MTSLSRPWACALTMFTFVGSSLAFSQTHWMEDNWATLGNRTLAQVTLPGTHDSGAFNLTTALEPGDSADPVSGPTPRN